MNLTKKVIESKPSKQGPTRSTAGTARWMFPAIWSMLQILYPLLLSSLVLLFQRIMYWMGWVLPTSWKEAKEPPGSGSSPNLARIGMCGQPTGNWCDQVTYTIWQRLLLRRNWLYLMKKRPWRNRNCKLSLTNWIPREEYWTMGMGVVVMQAKQKTTRKHLHAPVPMLHAHEFFWQKMANGQRGWSILLRTEIMW